MNTFVCRMNISQEVLTSFKELDIDKDGKITVQELKQLLEKMGKRPVVQSSVEAFIKKHDMNGDLCWSVEELANMMQQK